MFRLRASRVVAAGIRQLITTMAILLTLFSLFNMEQRFSLSAHGDDHNACVNSCASDQLSQAPSDVSSEPENLTEVDTEHAQDLTDAVDAGHCQCQCHAHMAALVMTIPSVAVTNSGDVVHPRLCVTLPEGPTFTPDLPPVRV